MRLYGLNNFWVSLGFEGSTNHIVAQKETAEEVLMHMYIWYSLSLTQV